MAGLVVGVWGKGGVGKSTVSAALGVALAGLGLRVAVVSTDVLPSILWLVGGGEPGRWLRACGVEFLAVSEELARAEWRRRFGDEVCRVLGAFFGVGCGELLGYLEQAPWVLEQFYAALVAEAAGRFDAVVWDTAGAGGGLLMMELEEKLYRHLRLAPRIYARLGGGLDEVIRSWRRLAEWVLGVLRGPGSRHLVVGDAFSGPLSVVSIASWLRHEGLEPWAVVVNRVPGPRHACLPGWLLDWAREAREAAGREAPLVAEVPLLGEPPRGCRGLERLLAEAPGLRGLAERLALEARGRAGLPGGR